MKYIKTAIAEQETIINILYEEQIISIYSSRSEVIPLITKALGKPSIKHEKNKTYLTGATWNIPFADSKKLNSVLMLDVFVDEKIDVKPIKIEKEKTKKVKKTKIKLKENKTKVKPKAEVNTKTKVKPKETVKTKKTETKTKAKPKVEAKPKTKVKEKVTTKTKATAKVPATKSKVKKETVKTKIK